MKDKHLVLEVEVTSRRESIMVKEPKESFEFVGSFELPYPSVLSISDNIEVVVLRLDGIVGIHEREHPISSVVPDKMVLFGRMGREVGTGNDQLKFLGED